MQRKGFLRNFIFGAEDSLVSTVGLLSGISFAGLSSKSIIASGVILIIVEALSMGAGSYVAEDSTNDLSGVKENQFSDALVMLFSYLLVGLIPLFPYTVMADTRLAFYYSVAFTLISLFTLGLFKGYYTKKNGIFSAVKITTIGAVVIAISIYIGSIVKL